MIHIADERIKKGIQICVESVQIVCQHPILAVYALFQGMLAIIAGIITYYLEYPNVIAALHIMISLFVDFCIARHVMHILRQQPTGMQESCWWVFYHSKQIIVWILVSMLLNISSILLILIPIAMISSMGSGFSQFFVTILALLVMVLYVSFISLVAGIVIPILATENISVLAALKRSVRVVWHNLMTYFVMLITQLLMVAVCLLPLIGVLSLFIVVAGNPYIKFIAMLFTIFLTIAKTIFYYLFYVQPSLELAEISVAQQM